MASSWRARASVYLVVAGVLLLYAAAGCSMLQLDEAASLDRQALASDREGRTEDAVALAKRAVEIREKAQPPDPAAVAKALDTLARIYRGQQRHTEAEPLYQRALEIREKTLPADHPDIAASLDNLAHLYWEMGRAGQAERLADRVLAMREKALPAGHGDIADSLNFRAMLHHTLDQLDDADRLYTHALTIREKALPPDNVAIAAILNNLATLRQKQARLGEAALLHLRALGLQEKALPANHPAIADTLNNLAFCYMQQRRLDEAEAIFKRVLAIKDRTLPEGHPDFIHTLANLSEAYYFQKRWQDSLLQQRRATAYLLKYGNQEAAALAASISGRGRREFALNRAHFLHHVRAAYRVAEADPAQAAELSEEAFTRAQLAGQTAAARALSRMAARLRTADQGLAQLARERQDLEAQWQAADKELTASLYKPAGQRTKADDAARTRIGDIDARIGDIDARLLAAFPDYRALAAPKPLGLDEVRQLLHADEALLFYPFLDQPQLEGFPAESFAWVVTKAKTKWVRLALSPNAITERVQALRCGLDATAWATKAQFRRCRTLLKAEPQFGVLPFDLALAHRLYRDLIGPFEALIEGKRLLVVVSGALGSLPLQVLVKAKPEPGAYQAAKWLGAQHPITVLPAVSSLAALRSLPKQTMAAEAYIGFGDPALAGGRYCDKVSVPPSCPDATPTRVAAAHETVRRAAGQAIGKLRIEGKITVSEIERICPLPDTAFELECVARSLGADDRHIHIRAKATEGEVKRLSRSGALGRARIVHFATHGLLPGNESYLEKALVEPALVFTPPKAATEEDDGLLTASEIATLKLNADWVILSACNTAGGARLGAESLSGLSRAFLHAGARALLVSHWEVYSSAAVKLTTRAFAELGAGPDIGRAEAMRRSMAALIGEGGFAAHPAYWAPFVVVGEGGQ